MKTIHITQDSGQHNFSSLFTITENIVIVCTRDCPIFGGITDHMKQIKEKLKYFNPEQDMIVMVGDPINISLCVHEVMMKGKEVTTLKWDRQTRFYVPVKIPNTLTEKGESE